MGLKEAIQNIWSSDYVQKNPNKAYKVSYADEYAKVAAFVNGGAEPNWSGFSKMGKGLCEVEVERRKTAQPEPEPEPEPGPSLGLLVSKQANRSGAVPLEGQALEGNAYVFVDQSAGAVAPVGFHLDEDPDSSPIFVENNPPFDLLGGSSAAANPWNTASVVDGLHRIEIRDGAGKIGEAHFTVDNPELPPPEPEPEPQPGGVLYALDWEYPNADGVDPSSGWGKQCENVAPEPIATRGTLSKVTSPVDKGSHAARFSLPPNDSSHNRSACELIRRRDYGYALSDYYGINYYFPADWREPASVHWGLTCFQPNYQGVKGAAVGFNAHIDFVNVVVESGYWNQSTGHMQYRTDNGVASAPLGSHYAIPRERFAKEVWHKVILHVHWHSDPAKGVIETFHRRKGESSWVRTSHLTGLATVQWKDGYDPANTDRWTTDKIGAYRGNASYPLTLNVGNWCRASSLDAAKAFLAD